MKLFYLKFRALRKYVLLFFLLLIAKRPVFSQDTNTIFLRIDTSAVIYSWISSMDYLIAHSPTQNDNLFYNNFKHLVSVEPTSGNYDDYYSLAQSLWELEKIKDAEKMFLKITESNQPFYENSTYHSSDIPGDTTSNIYGYGSYTSNYKNSACKYLTKIYIEKKQFDKALKYLEYADKKYVVQYNCGTGYMWYQNELNQMYGLCYEGLKRYNDILDLFLPEYNDAYNALLIRSVKHTYTSEEIKKQLAGAINAIVFTPDTIPSYSYTIHNYGLPDEMKVEKKYFSAIATTKLFGREINLARPELENDETATKEDFIIVFKESSFYKGLTSED